MVKLILSIINLLAIMYLITIGGVVIYQDKITWDEPTIKQFVIIAPIVAWLILLLITFLIVKVLFRKL